MTSEARAREIDTEQAELSGQARRAQGRLDSATDAIHRAARDRHEYIGRHQYWKRTFAEVLRDVQSMASHGDARDVATAQRALAAETAARNDLAGLLVQIQELEAIYRADPWPRYFPCDTRDGHIHSSERGCSTIRFDTAMIWRPDLSGKSLAEAVAELGEALCTFCYPDAPSDWKAKTLGQVKDERTRAKRDAVKTERETAKAIKRLAQGEVFRTSYGHDRVETVARCKELIRRSIETKAELDHHTRSGMAPGFDAQAWDRLLRNIADMLDQQEQDAEQAVTVLLAREARHAGWGATQAEIDKMIATAEKKYAKSMKAA